MTEHPPRPRGRPRLVLRLLHHPSAVAGLAILGIYIGAAIFAPLLSPYDPTKQHLTEVLMPFSPDHPLGTDQLGRDELTRLMYGGRYSLAMGALSVLVAVGIGSPIGALSAFYGGRTDMIAQRLTDVLLSFPGILLALTLVAGFGPGLVNVIVAVGVTSLPTFIRLMRATVLSTRQLPYVEAARSVGQRDLWIVLDHLVPNSLSPTIVQTSLQLGSAIIVAAGLGFLGLGVPPPTPEWGQMLGEGRNLIFAFPSLATIPGIAISGAVLAFNLVGDGLRDVLDPRQG